MKHASIEIPRGLLLQDGHRDAGSAEIDGKTVEWGEAYVVTILPLEKSKARDIRKYVVAPNREAAIQKALADVGWGSVISLEMESNQVVNVSVELDWSDQIAI